MEYNFTFKNRNYKYNADTQELRLITAAGGTVPVVAHHPALAGISEFIEKSVLTR